MLPLCEIALSEWAEGTLPEAFRTRILGIALWQWLGLAAILLIAWLAGLLLRAVLARLFRLNILEKAARVTSGSGRALKRSLALIVASLLAMALVPALEMPPTAQAHTLATLNVLTLIGATWLVAAIWEVACDVLMTRADQLSRQTTSLVIPFTRRAVRFLIFTIGGIVAVALLGYNVAGLIAGLGIGGVALALAAKDSVENVFGALTIVFDRPFALGDWIRVDKVDGVVEEINLRSTRVRTMDDSVVTLPNSNLIKASVENLGRRRYRRLTTIFTLCVAVPVARIEEFLEAVRTSISALPGVRKEGLSIGLLGFSDAGAQVQLVCQIEAPDLVEELAQRHRTLTQVLRLAEEMSIPIVGQRI